MKQFTSLKIKTQFKIILTCLIISCLGTGTLTYIAVKHLLVKNAAIYAQNISQKFNSEIEYLFNRVSSIYDHLQFDKNIEQIFLKPYTENTPEYIQNITVQFASYSVMNRDISDIAMVNQDMHWSSFFNAQSLDKMAAKLGTSAQMQSLGIKTIPLTHSIAPEGQHLVFAKNIFGIHDSKNYGKLLGSIILSIDPTKSPINLPQLDGNHAYFILADKNFHAYPFNCSADLCEQILAQCSELSKFTSNASVQQETKDYLLYISYLPSTEYYLISALDKHNLNYDLAKVTSTVVLIVLVVLFFILFLMSTIRHNMVNPINQLYLHIKELKELKRIASNKPKLGINLYGCEEIHSLSQEFNDMIQEAERLNNQLHTTTVNLYETKLGKKQAELDYLRSQINPHFLYNALESVKDIGLEHNIPEIASIANAIGKMFRYNVKGTSTVPFSQELEITRAYLDIQLARFPGKFSAVYSVRENTLDLPVMKLLLQPLVENAVYHGLESITGKGTIFIGARLNNNDLVVTVQDDGIGIDAQTLRSIQKHLEDTNIGQKAEKYIGILNVHYRIRLRYGSPYGLSIESVPGNGTKVILRFPKESNSNTPL